MSVEVAVSHRAAGLAPAARLLAALWSRPAAEDLGAWADALAEVPDLGAATEVAAVAAALEAADPDELVGEYERLLVGPGGAPCPPYESLWRGDQPAREQGRLMGAAAADAARVYRDLGLVVRADAHELPDHLAIEWEALAYAFEQDAAEASAELARGHLAVWMPAFCDAVGRETTSPFYAALARLTAAWTATVAG